MSVLTQAIDVARGALAERVTGRVESVRGLTVLVRDLGLPMGSTVRVGRGGPGGEGAFGEVVGFEADRCFVMAMEEIGGVGPGDPVVGVSTRPTIGVGSALLGRCIDGLGRCIDGGPQPAGVMPRPIGATPVGAMRRTPIREPLWTGIRSIDLMNTIGRGQRLGVFAGPGVGKSTLVGMIARGASSDVNVISLIGERGREVREFVEHVLGAEGLRRSVVVVATGDESPVMRVRAAMAACAIAEHFRDLGAAVMLLMDSLTRFAHAQRQVGLSVGEPPATRGYTPSVFASLATLLERAGSVDGSGSITGLYSVLVEGDDATEPISDAVRGILDGHVMLSRELAQRGHFPAIDVLDSISRVADDVCDPVLIAARRQVRRLMSSYRKVEELVRIGAYARGSDPEADVAIRFEPRIRALMQQGREDPEPPERARGRLIEVATEAGAAMEEAQRLGAAQAAAQSRPPASGQRR